MQKIFTLAAISIICTSCGASPEDQREISDFGDTENTTSEVATIVQQISYGNNDCWITNWDDYWIDPNNPGSGDHVVAWFHCSDAFATGYWTVTTDLPWTGYERNWMVWDLGSANYQVFIDGWYYWPLVSWGGFEPWEAIYTTHLS